jgi:hypothetical protein
VGHRVIGKGDVEVVSYGESIYRRLSKLQTKKEGWSSSTTIRRSNNDRPFDIYVTNIYDDYMKRCGF